MNLPDRWREVYGLAVRFADEIAALPEVCTCGDAAAHLVGRCRCCAGHTAEASTHPGGGTCSSTLAELKADFSVLCEDLGRFTRPSDGEAAGEMGLEVRRGVFMALSDLRQIANDLDRASESVVGFLRTCAMADLSRLKHHAAALRTHVERVDPRLRAG